MGREAFAGHSFEQPGDRRQRVNAGDEGGDEGDGRPTLGRLPRDLFGHPQVTKEGNSFVTHPIRHEGAQGEGEEKSQGCGDRLGDVFCEGPNRDPRGRVECGDR